jgi:hypothetical protein
MSEFQFNAPQERFFGLRSISPRTQDRLLFQRHQV